MSTNIIKEEIGFKTSVGFKVYPKMTGSLVSSEEKTINELKADIPIKGKINNANFSSIHCKLIFIIKKKDEDIVELEYWNDTVLKPVNKDGKLQDKDFEIFAIDKENNESIISLDILRLGVFGKGKIGWKITSDEYPNFPVMEIKPEESKVSFNLPLDISITDKDNNPVSAENLKIGSKININFKFIDNSPFNGCTAEFYIWESVEETYKISEPIPNTVIKYREKIDNKLEKIPFLLGCRNENPNEPQFYCNYEKEEEKDNTFEFNYAIKITDKPDDADRNKEVSTMLKGRFDNILIPELIKFKIDLKKASQKNKEENKEEAKDRIAVDCEFKNFDPDFKFNMDINLYSYLKENDDKQTHIKLLESINDTVFVEGNKIKEEIEIDDNFFKEVILEKADEPDVDVKEDDTSKDVKSSAETKTHIVKNKESIQTIASSYGTTVQAIIDANPELKSHISTSSKGTKWFWDNDSVTIPVSSSNKADSNQEAAKEENKGNSSDSKAKENSNKTDEEASKEKNKIFAELSFGPGTIFSQVVEFEAAKPGEKDKFDDFPVLKEGFFATKATGTGVCSNLLDFEGAPNELISELSNNYYITINNDAKIRSGTPDFKCIGPKIKNGDVVDVLSIEKDSKGKEYANFICLHRANEKGWTSFKDNLKPFDNYVKESVITWLTRDSAQVKKALKDAADTIFVNSPQYSINTLRALYAKESSYGLNLRDKFSSYAAGHFQFEKNTAEAFGLSIKSPIDERFEITKAAIAAAKYVMKLDDYFKKDTILIKEGNKTNATIGISDIWERKNIVIAAYNAGQGRLAKTQAAAKGANKNPKLWEESQLYLKQGGADDAKCFEVRDYVFKVLAFEKEFERQCKGTGSIS